MWRRLIALISIVLVLGLGGKASAELVARYSFDDYSADDSAGYYADGDGTFFGDAHVVDDVNRQSPVLSLDGDGDYVKVLNSAVADFNTESFSFAFWAKTSVQAPWYYFWKGAAVEDVGLIGVNCYHDNSEEVRFCLYNDGDKPCPCSDCKVRTEVDDVNMVTGNWVHITCVRDKSVNLRFYVNAQLGPGNNPVTDCMRGISNPGNLHIGANYRENLTEFFPGMMDDFRVYNHALTVSEIEQIMAEITDPNLASQPSPRNYAGNVCPDANLIWAPGRYAAKHDVYLGTNFDDVNDANDPNALPGRGRQDANSYDPPGLLEYGTVYYWRIDEVNGVNIWKGEVWRFTVEDGKARDPDPGDGVGSVPADKVLSWTPGCFAAWHDVYFGMDFNDVNDANDPNTLPGRGRRGTTSYEPPSDLASGATYYWRIDEVNESGIVQWPGDVWSFTAAGGFLLYYKFDETGGDTVHDYSGLGHDEGIAAEGEPAWDPDGYDAGCLAFNDDTHIGISPVVLKDIGKEITVAVWLNNGSTGRYSNIVFESGAGDSFLRVEVPDEDGDVYWRAGNDSNDVLIWEEASPAGWRGEWHHFAFVKDENAGNMRIYLNGLPVAENTGTSADTLAGVRNTTFRIGGPASGGNAYKGKMDEFRIYDCALSPSEIAGIFRGGDLASAWGPSPYDGEDEVPYDVVLRWRPGDYAADPNAHEVYFGTGWDDVNDANNSLPVGTSVYKGPQDLDSNSYDPPGLLVLGQTYYWRIDEVNDANNDRWKGKIWSFTVADYITIDDFEDDTAQDPPTNDWYKIGSAGITLRSTPPVIGEHSMRYAYDNWFDGGPGYYSEIESISLEANDWTSFELKLLSLWFYGDSANAATITEQMYVYLKDNDACEAQVKYGDAAYEDMTDVQIEDWQEWLIPLSRFSTNDVNLANLDNLCIGFGIRGWGASAGFGVVYFDNIRLYPGRCIPSLRAPPAADLNNDCEVDYEDVKIMADTWLQIDVNLGAVEVPDPCVLHYKFEETSSTVTDYSGQGHHGTAKLEDGSVTDAFWEPNGVYGRCIRFERQEKEYIVAVPNDVFNSHITNNKITISVWVNWPDPETMPDETNQLFNVHGGPGTDYNSIIGIETQWREGQMRFWDTNGVEDDDLGITYAVNEPDWCYGWNHYAFVKDASVTPGKLRIYHNGVEVNECDSNTPIRLPADNVWIGMATDEPNDGHKQPSEWHDEYTGLVDEFRIYNVALSEAKIKYIASDGTGIFTVQSIANLYNDEALGDRAVNLRDFAELAKGWLEKKFWP